MAPHQRRLSLRAEMRSVAALFLFLFYDSQIIQMEQMLGSGGMETDYSCITALAAGKSSSGCKMLKRFLSGRRFATPEKDDVSFFWNLV